MNNIRDLVYREDAIGLLMAFGDSGGLEKEYLRKSICGLLPFCADLDLEDMVRGSLFPYLMHTCFVGKPHEVNTYYRRKRLHKTCIEGLKMFFDIESKILWMEYEVHKVEGSDDVREEFFICMYNQSWILSKISRDSEWLMARSPPQVINKLEDVLESVPGYDKWIFTVKS